MILAMFICKLTISLYPYLPRSPRGPVRPQSLLYSGRMKNPLRFNPSVPKELTTSRRIPSLQTNNDETYLVDLIKISGTPVQIAKTKAICIKKSDSSYYSQVILAVKPDGTFRFCIDYRNLNDATESASWPIPNIKQMLARLGAQKADTFGAIDLTAGYHQAPVDLQTRPYTSFITFMGIYEFTRLPFGPKRAPSYFQEVMASIVLKD